MRFSVSTRWKGCLIKLAEVYQWTKVKHACHIDGIRALRRHLLELIAYLEANHSVLVNYGARHRCGEPISTAFVESAINEIVARRMVKSKRGVEITLHAAMAL